MLNSVTLNSYVGQPIKEICPHGYDSSSDNHCAHFVSHVLQLGMGYTCAHARRRTGGANIRVQELFSQCMSTREVHECPTVGEGLIFVSGRMFPKSTWAFSSLAKFGTTATPNIKSLFKPLGSFCFTILDSTTHYGAVRCLSQVARRTSELALSGLGGRLSL